MQYERQAIVNRKLRVLVYRTEESMGNAAALYTAQAVRSLLQVKQYINMVFAAAPSQSAFLASLISLRNIDWKRINAFHLDEYIGLQDSTKSFESYLREHLFSRVSFRTVHYINDVAVSDPEETGIRYGKLLEEYDLDIACIGIGQTGHIAFNDPSVADFADPKKVKLVKLENESRQQQVNDGCFSSLDEVPTHAVTLTIPSIMTADKIVCVVPTDRKSKAVERTLDGPITTKCPASILRRHQDVAIFLDKESASLI